jgi:NAD(P)H-hydrate repair Nnr-like enzyme with NAD(P)H-hydrate dehydratase domain
MASAGMGDVLAGIVGALVAQGVAALPALLSGVHLHGLAADHLAQAAGGLVGITAGEVADRARAVVNALVYGNG